MAKKKEKIAPVQGLFSKFGEFNSSEELNMSAEGLKEEGDFESLKELARENGIDEWDVEDYIEGDLDRLSTPATAAIGRLKVELETLTGQIKYFCEFYAKFAEIIIVENEQVAAGVMKKGARIKGLYDVIYSYATKHKSNGCFSGSTTDIQDQEIVKAYYTGGSIEKLFNKWFA